MKLLKIYSVLAICCTICFSCNGKDEDKKPGKNDTSSSHISALNWYNVEDGNAKFIELPGRLSNISGICFTDDGRLFCDSDDSSGVSQIDPQNGTILKTFFVGTGMKNSGRIKSNFEDLAIVGSRFFIMNSHGRILECKEGKQGEYVQFDEYKTKLGKDNNIEGMCFDPETNSLLLACKDYPGEGYEKSKTIYTFSLSNLSLTDTPRFILPSGKIKRNTADFEFRPSGLARNNITGTFFVLASHGHTIIEVSKDGEIINQKDLPKEIHPQPEGITFSKDNTLFISNEGKTTLPRLITYKMNRN
jgi:uncharacterized protein YjiK